MRRRGGENYGRCRLFRRRISYQQGKYEEAAKVFRQWEIDDPRNWKPGYYLSLDYGYQNKDQEASNLASWSKNIADHEKTSGFGNPRFGTCKVSASFVPGFAA